MLLLKKKQCDVIYWRYQQAKIVIMRLKGLTEDVVIFCTTV